MEGARKDLAALQKDYLGFVDELRRSEVAAERQKLIEDAAEVSRVISLVIGALSTAQIVAAPFSAGSIVKLLNGEPVQSALALIGPDQGKISELDARLTRLDAQIQEHKQGAFTDRIDAAAHKLEEARSLANGAAKNILNHKLQTLQALNQLSKLETSSSGFFHALSAYQKSVATAAAALDEAAVTYYRWLASDPAEAELLLRHIELDKAHVQQNSLDRGGKWTALATDAERWLRTMFLSWYQPEIKRVGICITGFRELRHLAIVNEAVNRVIEATGSERTEGMGKYSL